MIHSLLPWKRQNLFSKLTENTNTVSFPVKNNFYFLFFAINQWVWQNMKPVSPSDRSRSTLWCTDCRTDWELWSPAGYPRSRPRPPPGRWSWWRRRSECGYRYLWTPAAVQGGKKIRQESEWDDETKWESQNMVENAGEKKGVELK